MGFGWTTLSAEERQWRRSQMTAPPGGHRDYLPVQRTMVAVWMTNEVSSCHDGYLVVRKTTAAAAAAPRAAAAATAPRVVSDAAAGKLAAAGEAVT